ncbi:class I SAM-dependent methyltransferase [Streptomyces paradoxus]|uniref:class I SAM-dependent methyltransferase n=1 Tax=Streptomyces paradoxus TaxID=66375 RepID=UPI0036F93D6F
MFRRILDSLPVGAALDAACGTGRHTIHLHELGHDVIGVDASPDMLARARESLPEVGFHEAELQRLPLPDDAVDTVVCALALTHVPVRSAVLVEFARVLRPGGHRHLVISDSHLLAPTSGRPCPAVPARTAARPSSRSTTARAAPSTRRPPWTHS